MNENVREHCEKLHKHFNSLDRFYYWSDENKERFKDKKNYYSFDNLKDLKKLIYKNGIYILFEEWETAHWEKNEEKLHRIVRIGIHKKEDFLPNRLSCHFIKENKEGSIFRKNIGRAIIEKEGLQTKELNSEDYYLLEDWQRALKKNEKDLKIKEKKIEEKISKHMRKNFSFCVIEVEKKETRKKLEKKLIWTISACNICRPSDNWFWKNCKSKGDKVSKSWLWQYEHLVLENANANRIKENTFSNKEFQDLKKKYILKIN